MPTTLLPLLRLELPTQTTAAVLYSSVWLLVAYLLALGSLATRQPKTVHCRRYIISTLHCTQADRPCWGCEVAAALRAVCCACICCMRPRGCLVTERPRYMDSWFTSRLVCWGLSLRCHCSKLLLPLSLRPAG